MFYTFIIRLFYVTMIILIAWLTIEQFSKDNFFIVVLCVGIILWLLWRAIETLED